MYYAYVLAIPYKPTRMVIKIYALTTCTVTFTIIHYHFHAVNITTKQ